MTLRFRPLNQRAAFQHGWASTEYIAVMLGLMAVWRGAEAVLLLIRQHHAEFSWALMIPI